MKSGDLPVLSKRLTELAEYYDKRPVGTSALKVWLDVLGECSIDDVQSVLTDWPKSHRQMPLADEVLKSCRSILSDRIEAQAEAYKNQAASISDLVKGLSKNLSPEAKNAREEISDWMSRMHAPRNPMAWAYKLRDREIAGEKFEYIQQKYWREALKF